MDKTLFIPSPVVSKSASKQTIEPAICATKVSNAEQAID